MAKVTLQPDQTRLIATSGRYLSIVNASGSFAISSPELGTLIGEVHRQFELERINQVFFENVTDTAIHIEYEVANIKVTSSGNGSVKIANALTIGRIDKQVDVRATLRSATTMISHDDIEIAPRSQLKLIDANNLRAELFIKNTSVHSKALRIGDTHASQRNGIPLLQNGAFSMNHGAAVYAFNPADTPAKISLYEVLQ